MTGVLLGYITDVMGGGVKGIHSLAMALVYLLTIWVSRHVYLAGNISVILATFIIPARLARQASGGEYGAVLVRFAPNKLGIRFFDRNPIGRLITRVTNDIEVLNEMFS